jgi:predicted branched-subunit amino acid permease
MDHTASTSQKAPGEYFDESSFKTLYGGVFITWVTTSIIVDILGFTDPKILGLIIALIVAFIGFFMSENRSVKKLVITPFNGFLIYLTIMGGTSFLPPPVPYDSR